MADRYWVGGTNTWNSTAGTKWATTSGGAGGASVPTAADDVFFDAASGAVTVTTGNTVSVCRSLNCTGFTGTLDLANASAALTVGDASGGALTLVAGMTLTKGGSSAIVLASTSNNGGTGWGITTGGKTMPGMTFNGVGGKWVLQDACVANGGTGVITLTNGTLDTNSQSVTAIVFTSTNANTRTLTLGSSAITLTGSATTVWNTSNVTNLTMTANTAVVTMTAAGATFNCGTKDLNGLSLVCTNADPVIGSGAPITLKDLTVTGTAVKGCLLLFSGNVTCTGTFTVNGNSATNRIWVRSNAGVPIPRTITAATVVASNADFQDIVGAGAGNWDLSAITGLSGDAGRNSGITFTTPATQTRSGAGGNWSTAGNWTSRVPLPQDDVVVGSGASGTINPDMPRLGADVDFTGFTGTLTTSIAMHIFGSLTLVAGMTANISHALTWHRGGTLTSAGKTFNNITIIAVGETFILGDALAMAGSILTHNDGTFDSDGFTITCLRWFSQSSRARTVYWRDSTINITDTIATTSVDWTTGLLTASLDEATVVFANASNNTRIFGGSALQYGALRYTVADSPGQLTINGNNHFGTLEVGPGRTLAINAGTSQNVDNWLVDGEDRDYVRLPGVSGNYLSAPDSAALSITGDIDIRVRVALADWTPSTNQRLCCKASGGASQISWIFWVDTAGKLRLGLSSDGTTLVNTAPSSDATGITDGAVKWVRATWRDSDNRVQYFTSDDGSSWTQLGTDQTSANAGIFDSTSIVEIGTNDAGVTNPSTGKFYRVQIRNNVLDDGTGIVFDADLSTKITGANSFTESSSNAATVTVNGALAQVGDGRIAITSTTASAMVLAKPTADSYGNKWRHWGASITQGADQVDLQAAAQNWVNTLDSPALSITGDLDLRVRAKLPDWTPGSIATLVAKWLTTGNQRSYNLRVTSGSTGQITFSVSSDGTAVTTATFSNPGFTDGTTQWLRVTWRASDGRCQLFTADGSLLNPTAADFTQSGTNQTANVGAIADTTAAVSTGAEADGATVGAPVPTTIYAVEIRNGIDGTLVADPRFGYDTGDYFVSEYSVITASRAIGAAEWYAPPPSVNGGTNYGWLFTDPPPVGGLPKVWDGANWTTYSVKIWNGAAWAEAPMKVWDSGAWELV